MRALVLGTGGMLARDLIAQAPQTVALMARTRADTDVTAAASVTAALREARPDVVINCAAYTNVDQAESQPDAAFLVNGAAPGTIAEAVKQAGLPALVVHYSTDYVFDGQANRPYREDDPTSPVGVYGASKLAGEQALQASGVRHLIVRTQWLFGVNGRSFPRTMWERATTGKATRVVRDQTGRPTYTADLARATWKLLGEDLPGAGEIVHVANGGTATWYDVARRVFQAAGTLELLSACTSAEYPTLAKRPAYSVLATDKYQSLTGDALPPWEDAVDRFLERLREEAMP